MIYLPAPYQIRRYVGLVLRAVCLLWSRRRVEAEVLERQRWAALKCSLSPPGWLFSFFSGFHILQLCTSCSVKRALRLV